VVCSLSANIPRTLSNNASLALIQQRLAVIFFCEAQSWYETIRSIKRRFFLVLLGKLSSWREHTHNRSTELLLILMVYCKEALTEDFHRAIALIAKAIGVETLS
jgi:hypothetical protein